MKLEAGLAPQPRINSEQGRSYFYEVSRRPKNVHKKLVAEAGTKLITPSGARVPPGWTNIWMTTDMKSQIQAIGFDSKGRKVYLYSTEHTGRAAAAKFSRLKAFAKAYPSFLRKLRLDKNTSEEALVLYLISKTGFRIGSDTETLARIKAFGASTLRCSHINIKGKKVLFNFTGKKGQPVNKVLKDAFLAENIAKRCEGNDAHKIFRTTDDNIRKYLNSIPGGEKFTVKDFRTYLGTSIALRQINDMPKPKSDWEFKRLRRKVGEVVARELGNTPTIALKS